MNLVVLKGNVGKDPELVTISNEQEVAKISLCTKKVFKGKETVLWHSILAWGKPDKPNSLVKTIMRYVRTGQELLLQGEINYRKYRGKDGKDVLTTEIVIHHLEFCGSKTTERQAPASNEELP